MRALSRALLTTSTFPSGESDKVTARFVLDLATHLAAHLRVVVLAPAAPGTRSREQWGDVTVLRYRYFAPARLQVITGGEGVLATLRANRLARAQLPLLVAAQWAVLPGIVRRERIDLVNTHWIVPQGLNAAVWRRVFRLPHVTTAHGADVAFLARSRVGGPLTRFIFSQTDYLIADSEHLAVEVERRLGRPVPHRAIPMGMSQALFRPDGSSLRLRHADDERVVLFVGKLVPKKGVNVLLEAAARLKAMGRRVRVVVIGGGPLEESIRQSLFQLDLIDRVDLKGWVRNDQLPSYYRAADVVCVPSVRDHHGETEGTPVVLQEALGAGAIVVASDISGIPEVVRDGDNGWIVPPSDANALARALMTALDMDDPSRQAMQQAARRTALGHSWERVAEHYLEAFGEAASRYHGNERR